MGWLGFLIVLAAGGLGGVALMCLFFLAREFEDPGWAEYEPHRCQDLSKKPG